MTKLAKSIVPAAAAGGLLTLAAVAALAQAGAPTPAPAVKPPAAAAKPARPADPPAAAPAKPARPAADAADAGAAPADPAAAPADNPADAPLPPAGSDNPAEPAPAPAPDAAAPPTTVPGGPTTAPAGEPVQKEIVGQAAAQVVIAERFAEFAEQTIRSGPSDPRATRMAAALLRAAATLDPQESRHWQLLTEAGLQLGDEETLMFAMEGYRKIAPSDRVAQVQRIELYASRQESVDKELDYLRSLVGKTAVAEEVRAHVNVMIARRLAERGEQKAAAAAIDEALKLNPFDLAALDLKYQQVVADNAGAADRATALLNVVRGNPCRPEILAEVGRLLAGVGLTKESVDWMDRALRLSGRAGGLDAQAYHDLAVDYAAETYVGGQLQLSRRTLDQLLGANANDFDAWLLRLVLERSSPDKAAFTKARDGAAAALAARWAEVARLVSGKEAPPAGDAAAAPAPAEPAPQPDALAQQVKAANDPGKQSAFVSAASDYAWFELYYNENPGAAGKWIDALEAVLPEDNTTLRRLRGWHQLANKQPDEARKTLEPLQGSDPLAGLGVLRLGERAAPEGDKAAQAASDEQARKLLQDYPSGLVGAILAQALKDRGIKPQPHPDAAAVRAQLAKFPRGWLDVADNPQRFYQLRVEPQGIAHGYDQPMMVQVLLTNLTDMPITIGDAGVIQPGLWFDAEATAVKSTGMLRGVAFERIAGTTVLPPRSAIGQYVRVDRGRLADYLNGNPTQRVQVTGWVTTNYSRLGKGFGPGVAGYTVPFQKKLTRVSFQINKPESLQRLATEIEQGLPELRMRDLSLAAAYMPAPAAQANKADADAGADVPAGPADGQPPQPDAAQTLAAQIGDLLRRATESDIPGVAAWAKFELARVAADADAKGEQVASLLADSRWEARLLGLLAARSLPHDAAVEVVGKIAESETEDPVVKAYATEVLDQLQHPPATQPAAGDAAAAPAAAGEAPPDAPAVPPGQ